MFIWCRKLWFFHPSRSSNIDLAFHFEMWWHEWNGNSMRRLSKWKLMIWARILLMWACGCGSACAWELWIQYDWPMWVGERYLGQCSRIIDNDWSSTSYMNLILVRAESWTNIMHITNLSSDKRCETITRWNRCGDDMQTAKHSTLNQLRSTQLTIAVWIPLDSWYGPAGLTESEPKVPQLIVSSYFWMKIPHLGCFVRNIAANQLYGIESYVSVLQRNTAIPEAIQFCFGMLHLTRECWR